MKGYRVEGLTVPITMEEFIRQAEKRLIQGARVEDRLEGVPLKQRLESISAEEVEKLTPEEREKFRKLFEGSHPT